MPIARWICTGCGGREVPLDHFSATACGEKVCHPDMAAAILADRDGQYTRGSVRVSHGLGCPRRAAIEEVEDYAVDPLECNAALTGVAWHALLESVDERLARKNGRPPDCEVEVSGTIAGIKLKGKIDRLRGDLIEDHKHINDFSVKWIRQNGVKPEHRAQVSIYAELCEQSGLQRPKRGIIWYHSSLGGKDALIPMPVELMGVEEALAVRPYGCEYTVRELYEQANMFFNGVEPSGLACKPMNDWRCLPLAGQTIQFGSKTGCDYCAVRAICQEAENGAPF